MTIVGHIQCGRHYIKSGIKKERLGLGMEHWPSICEALGSNPSTAKKKGKKELRKEKQRKKEKGKKERKKERERKK
jgi:hypothetical protein